MSREQGKRPPFPAGWRNRGRSSMLRRQDDAGAARSETFRKLPRSRKKVTLAPVVMRELPDGEDYGGVSCAQKDDGR